MTFKQKLRLLTSFQRHYMAASLCLLVTIGFILGGSTQLSASTAQKDSATQVKGSASYLVQDQLSAVQLGLQADDKNPDTANITNSNDNLESVEIIPETSEEPADVTSGEPEFEIINRNNPYTGRSLYVGSHDPAGDTAGQWAVSNPASAAALRKISGNSIGIWLTRGMGNLDSYVSTIASDSSAKGQIPTLVVYGMPAEGCSGLPASADDYLVWVRAINSAIGNKPVVIVLEPDELVLTRCTDAEENQRIAVLAKAAGILKQNSNASIYIDAGHSNWVPADIMAERLKLAGISGVQGFSLNVSNYRSTSESRSYGQSISNLTGGAHYVVDTSRNGNGPTADNEWCNAAGRALGEKPGVASGRMDAYLWIKYPGESDLACNGGPAEGQWWPEYAVGLAQRASW